MSFNNISLINLNSQFNPFYSSITIDSSGNVGVGKIVPTTNLDVSGNTHFVNFLLHQTVIRARLMTGVFRVEIYFQ